MNNNVSQYPAALYSSMSEVGYRRERFTGEVLRSGWARQAGQRRRPRFTWLRPGGGRVTRGERRQRQTRPVASPHHFSGAFLGGHRAH